MTDWQVYIKQNKINDTADLAEKLAAMPVRHATIQQTGITS